MSSISSTSTPLNNTNASSSSSSSSTSSNGNGGSSSSSGTKRKQPLARHQQPHQATVGEDDPISSYAGSLKQQQQQQQLHQSGRMSTLKIMIILFSLLIISSVIFMHVHTSSLDFEKVQIFHTPINPIALEDKRLQLERQRLLRRDTDPLFDHNDGNVNNNNNNNDGDDHDNSSMKAASLNTIDDYKTNFENDNDPVNRVRRQKVRDAMKFAYHGYEKYAWGHDELKPVSAGHKDWVHGGMAMTMVDSLDTLYIMGLKDEFNRAVQYTKAKLPAFNSIPSTVSVFETVIRMVGGFLSAYDLSHEQIFLTKAKEMADIMSKAFDEQTNMFSKAVNLQTGRHAGVGSVVLAEVGTLQLEFRRLSQLTGDSKYDNMVTRVMNELRKNGPSDGLYPTTYLPHARRFHGTVSLGGLGDSFFEYLLKQWLLTGKTEEAYLEMYQRSLHGIMTKMVDNFDNANPPVSFIAEYSGGKIPRVGHLACFASGMLALGEANGVSQNAPSGLQVDSKEVMKVAEQFATACVQSYRMTATGIGPEGFEYHSNGRITGNGYYILRPETVESLFVLYRITGNKKYQDWAWELFNNIEKQCKTAYGYSGLHNVNQPGSYNDVQESFFLAETLKYLYLIFSPTNVIPLDEWVFNTEAHPLRITMPH